MTISQVSPSAYFATRGSGLSLEGVSVIAPDAAEGLEVAFARHADLGGFQQADAGCRGGQEGSCVFSAKSVDDLMLDSLPASSPFAFTVALKGRHDDCLQFTDGVSEA